MPFCERCAECAKTEPSRARKVLFGWGNVSATVEQVTHRSYRTFNVTGGLCWPATEITTGWAPEAKPLGTAVLIW